MRVSGEPDEADAFVRHRFQQFVNDDFRLGEAVWFHIADAHAFGDIEGDDHIPAHGFFHLRPCIPAWPGECDDDGGGGGEEEKQRKPPREWAPAFDQGTSQPRGGEGHPLPPPQTGRNQGSCGEKWG